MLHTIIFLVLTVLSAASLAAILLLSAYCILVRIAGKPSHRRQKSLRRAVIFFTAVMLLNVGLVVYSQRSAFTPPVTDENGNTPTNSIAELTELQLNGRKQWISLRGRDKNAPVLLFLAGGPGGTQMAAVRHELAALEKHFVVVNWDQPGSGKSYYATRTKKITVETYIEDGYALTEYLKARFSQEKIYLLGESWGSALGVFLADRYPDSYYAFIGTGQMVDFEETERIDYAKALEIAEARGDTGIVRRLKENGEPPYYGKNVTWKSAVYLNYLSAYMAGNREIHNPGYSTLRDIASPEYGLLDKVNFFRGVITTFNHVYQQLYTVDLRVDYARLDVPVYFFLGRHDVNAPTELAEEYYQLLDAPDKKLVWFEHSGHSPWINESDKFVEEVLSCLTQHKTQE